MESIGPLGKRQRWDMVLPSMGTDAGLPPCLSVLLYYFFAYTLGHYDLDIIPGALNQVRRHFIKTSMTIKETEKFSQTLW